MTRTLDVERQQHLVRLPACLRHRIFLLLGVARFDGRPYTYYLDGRKESRVCVCEEEDPPPARNFTGLLLSCRALYAETAALLYSANRFICYSAHGSLQPLRALLPTSLASLTSLKIVLNESSCHQPVDSVDYPFGCCWDSLDQGPWASQKRCAELHGSLHRRPLLDPAPGSDSVSAKLAAQAILDEWHDAALYLSAHIGVGRLVLSLVCDLDPNHPCALEAARLATTPIAFFPRLKGCHIWLCKTCNRPLQRLAQEAVLQARCGTSSPLDLERPATSKMPSALTGLPRELRLRIFEYTDLVTPWKEVTWSRQDRGYQVCRPPCDYTCPPHIHHGCQLSRCRSSEFVYKPGSVPAVGCFCRRRHAAFSLACHCWAPPTDLFLICRGLYQDAQFVFFSANRFIVHDFHATRTWDLPAAQVEPQHPNTESTARTPIYYPYERFAASEFLRDIVPTRCLADLRFLEFVFPPYVPEGWPQDGCAALLDWRATVDWIRGESGINVPALTLRLAMADAISSRNGRIT